MILGIIQARMGSRRLPGKSLLLLAGEPMIERYIERALRSYMIDEVILATTEKPEDDCLCDIAKTWGLRVFRGAEDDIANRLYSCAKEFGGDIIVRLCADNPLIEAREIDRAISTHIERNLDFTSNVDSWGGSDYPDGIGAEIYSIELLKRINDEATGATREHPHKFIREEMKCNNYGFPECPPAIKGFTHVRLDVNTREEYEEIRGVFDKFGHNNFSVTDYIGEVGNGYSNATNII